MLDKLKALITRSQEYAKLIASLTGGLLVIGAQFIPDPPRTLVSGIILAVTAYSVYRFPNITPDGLNLSQQAPPK